MEKQKVLILGGGNAGFSAAISATLHQLDQVALNARASNVFEIKLRTENVGAIGLVKPSLDHGWYRKFEKNGKKRNFKKAI